jgi:SAM-dependent methyltransferase
MTEPAWFENWFDSDYYHLLYQNRDEKEAEAFVSRLMQNLDLPKGKRVLDLACGKGRHSIFLNSLGYEVVGVDLSSNSIQLARKHARPGLSFKVGDMRLPQGNEDFDLIVNLFTSFGYFSSESENLQTLSAMFQALKPGGLLAIDFMNTTKVLEHLVPENRIERNGIVFDIRKRLENRRIMKEIRFSDQGKDWFFEERVQALTEADFRSAFLKTGFEVVLLWGNYQLEPYHPLLSDRMIFIVRKPG